RVVQPASSIGCSAGQPHRGEIFIEKPANDRPQLPWSDILLWKAQCRRASGSLAAIFPRKLTKMAAADSRPPDGGMLPWLTPTPRFTSMSFSPCKDGRP